MCCGRCKQITATRTRLVRPLILSYLSLTVTKSTLMSKRLASFRGPSAPTSSPVLQPTPPVIPPSPSRPAESTFHRRLRTLLQELRSISQTWDDIVLLDGLKAARTLVDARTELECVCFHPCPNEQPRALSRVSNMLGLLPPNSQPRSEIVGPKLAMMDKSIAQLDAAAAKLVRFNCTW